MTSDGIGPKGPRSGSSTDRGSAAEIGGEAASVIELSGAIKWFDVSKGYGFIVPDNGMPDILLHVTCLRRDGFQVAYEGARVVVEVLQRPRGLQAFRVLSMDESTAVHTPDIFIHMETLRRFGLTELRPGQYVLVRFGPGPKGLMAAEVRPEGAPTGPASH